LFSCIGPIQEVVHGRFQRTPFLNVINGKYKLPFVNKLYMPNVVVSLIDLNHIGLRKGTVLKKIHNQGVSLDLPAYLKTEVINADSEDSIEKLGH
jgi:hypothetical protein